MEHIHFCECAICSGFYPGMWGSSLLLVGNDDIQKPNKFLIRHSTNLALCHFKYSDPQFAVLWTTGSNARLPRGDVGGIIHKTYY